MIFSRDRMFDWSCRQDVHMQAHPVYVEAFVSRMLAQHRPRWGGGVLNRCVLRFSISTLRRLLRSSSKSKTVHPMFECRC